MSSDDLYEFISHVVAARKLRISVTRVKDLSIYSSLAIPEKWYEEFHLEKNMEFNSHFESVAMTDLKEDEDNKSDLNFSESIFFVITVITTIGYGTNSPITPQGKRFCVFLVCVGIPMNIILVSALASACMPLVRKSRNSLVNLFSSSSDRKISLYKNEENFKHWDSDTLDKTVKISEGKNIWIDLHDKREVAKLCFKPGCCLHRDANLLDNSDTQSPFRKWFSDSHLTSKLRKHKLQSKELKPTSMNVETSTKQLIHKVVSPSSSILSLPENRKCFSHSPSGNVHKYLEGRCDRPKFYPTLKSPKILPPIMKPKEVLLKSDYPIISNPVESNRRPTTKPPEPKKKSSKKCSVVMSDEINTCNKSQSTISVNINDYEGATDDKIYQQIPTKSNHTPPAGNDEKGSFMRNFKRLSRQCLFEKFQKSASDSVDSFSTETTLAYRARLSCIAFLHFLLSRSDLALTSRVRFSQLRYHQDHHGIFHIRLFHFFVLFLVVVVCTIFIPAAVFYRLEDNWTYLDSVYYCFVSLSTVGLGDLVPSQDRRHDVPKVISYVYAKNIYKLATSIYLIWGIVMTTVLGRAFQEIIDYEFSNAACGFEDKCREHRLPSCGSGAQFDNNSSFFMNCNHLKSITDG
uniref:Potassium channel domain-containing protein n=1 Tax=Trichobilharzia regenti TaxID=157069 RepID=A0AA85JIR0_TRIRE|nr:unnamed protein product [Trichobilharzia regenti]